MTSPPLTPPIDRDAMLAGFLARHPVNGADIVRRARENAAHWKRSPHSWPKP